jgi:hypothetical protein
MQPPRISTRIEQRRGVSRLGINCSLSSAFAQGTGDIRQSEVFKDSLAACIHGLYMVQVKDRFLAGLG